MAFEHFFLLGGYEFEQTNLGVGGGGWGGGGGEEGVGDSNWSVHKTQANSQSSAYKLE